MRGTPFRRTRPAWHVKSAKGNVEPCAVQAETVDEASLVRGALPAVSLCSQRGWVDVAGVAGLFLASPLGWYRTLSHCSGPSLAISAPAAHDQHPYVTLTGLERLDPSVIAPML